MKHVPPPLEATGHLLQSRLVSAPASRNVPDDIALVHAAQNGDRASFGTLYARYARSIHGILLARVPRAEVDDLMQDVFLSAMNRLRSLRDPAAFAGWLAIIARNRAIDWHRQAPDTTELPETLAAKAAPASEAARALEAIQQLPEAYRETLVLRLVEGMTGAEIAERTGLRAESVRVNLHRGMKMLREKLGMEACP
jgi:RNA polymerase sigma-70 factor (ECF subfamily)